MALFHAFITFNEYERLTAGRWGTGGCRCRQCARRVPRVLEFSLAEDVKNSLLERGARRALVGLFGEGWCNSEFASLHQKIRDNALVGLGKRTTVQNSFPLLFAAEHALSKLGNQIEPWADTVRDMILTARKAIDDVIAKEAEACFNTHEWVEIMENDGVRFEDGERVEWAMGSVLRGVKETFAPSLYQVSVPVYFKGAAVKMLVADFSLIYSSSPSSHGSQCASPVCRHLTFACKSNKRALNLSSGLVIDGWQLDKRGVLTFWKDGR
jgi:hypothetical protein